jgi:hypothetical protein
MTPSALSCAFASFTLSNVKPAASPAFVISFDG